ncbi:MAG TPA: DoxX family protein [Gemmatimonadales bacterium]|nr:DoxX family protein [Gemmatimonadales bacterium]
MNVLLWILQIALAFTYFAGGFYKLSQSAVLTSQVPSMPPGAWRALGIVEVLGAVLLIVPAALRWMPSLTPLAAALLALEAVGLAAVFWRRYSLKLTPKNPTVWPVVMGLLVAFVAYGRYVLAPINSR